MKSLRGFTLIELLVVIAIIAIIAAILFPVFSKAREKARQTSCASNLNQMGLAFMQYTEDYDELMPPLSSTDAQGPVSFKWLILPYVKSFGIFACPSNPAVNMPDWESGEPGITRSYEGARYDSGTDPSVFSMYGGNSVPTALASLQAPASTIDVVESTASFPDFSVASDGLFDCNENTCFSGYGGDLFAGHTGFANFLFCDGHVKAMHPLATIDKAEGGSGTVNMWTVQNGPFSPGDVANIDKVLSYSQTRYQ